MRFKFHMKQTVIHMKHKYQCCQLKICLTVTIYILNTSTSLITKLTVDVHLLQTKLLHETKQSVVPKITGVQQRMVKSSKPGETIKATASNSCYNNNYNYYYLYTKYLQLHTCNKSCLYGIQRCSYSVITAYGTCNDIAHEIRFALLH
jgi:hypothetical protein